MSVDASLNGIHPKKRRFSYPHVPLDERRAAWVSRILMVVTPLLSLTLVEALNYNNPWTDFSPLQTALNLVWYYLGELCFYFVLRRRTAAVKWGLGIAWGFGCANHYLLSFRGRTLFPGDFLTLQTAANVAGNYDYTPDAMQLATLAILVAYVLLVSTLPREPRHKFSWRRFLPVTAAAAVYLWVFFGTGFLPAVNIEPSMWTTRGNGLFLNFSVCLKYMRLEPPQGYSEDAALELAQNYPGLPAGAGEQPVNLIVIMNESLADLSVLPGVETNRDAMPFYRSLTENAVKGYAYSSVFGGTTANSEYEFLTGNTTAFQPAGTVPYQMYVRPGDPSLVGQMKALGYRCVASHPYLTSGWNRVAVYNSFGFDEMYFEGDFQDREYMRGDARTGYVTDRCDYENLVRMYEEKAPGERLFLFNITMQNHSAYNKSWQGLDREVWLTGALEGKYPTVDQYLSLVYQSDRALEYLVDYFARVDEPTMLLIFGDHQPQVATSFYTRLLGRNPDPELAQKKQMVPFLLWANYDIPEADGVELSLNYLSGLLAETANLPMTGYQQFLSQLHEQLPILDTVGCRDGAGTWYGENARLPQGPARAAGQYRILQYNNTFDADARVEDFFRLSGMERQ